jgi:hypothetical protein
MIDAGQASKMKRSLGSAMVLSDALEKFKTDNGAYPQDLDGEKLIHALTPRYLSSIPTDIYGQPFVVTVKNAAPAVISVGRGGFVVQHREVTRCQPYTTQGCP